MAIGFLLVGLLVPTVGTPSGGHLHGAYGSSRSRLSNYINALYMFRGEYGYFPSIFDDQGQLNLTVQPDSELFVEALSGRTKDDQKSIEHGNRRSIRFHSFSDSELEVTGIHGDRQIVDPMENMNIVVCIDHDGDGYVEVVEDGAIKQIRASVTIYTIPKEGERGIRL